MQVVSYLRNHGYSEDFIDQYKEKGLNFKFKRCEDLPTGWREGVMVVADDGCKGGTIKMIRFMSPNGTIIQNRALAVKYMKDNHYDESSIDAMFSLLIKKDGWQYDENLPDGWMKKQLPSTTTIYMSSTLQIFKKKHAVISYMKDHNFDEKTLKKTEEYLYAGKSPSTLSIKREPRPSTSQQSSILRPKRIKIDKDVIDWKPDSSLPSGWLSARDSDNNDHISNSKGDTFSSRIEAMRAMIETKQSSDDIFRMWKSLDLEGWVCDEGYLPPGWRRKYSDESKTHTYLSPLMEVIQSSKAFLKYIENSSDYNNDDIKKV